MLIGKRAISVIEINAFPALSQQNRLKPLHCLLPSIATDRTKALLFLAGPILNPAKGSRK
jgi:hypothetical protein